MSLIPPTNNPSLIVDDFILYATQHLTTVGGVITTTSLYPPVGTPGPGIILWTGYTVDPATKGGGSVTEPTVEELLAKIPDDNNTVEGATPIVEETGLEVLTDGGEDGGEQIELVKRTLPEDSPQSVVLDEQTAKEQTKVLGVDDNSPTNTNNPKPIDCSAGLDYNAYISKNFRLRDLSIGTVFPHKIKAQVGLSEQDIICNLKNVAENILEPLKARYPNIRVNSGFRGTASIPGGVSQHQKGEAVDVQFPGVTPQGYLPIANWIKLNLPFDQLIFEHGNSIWLHLSCKRTTQRKQLLTMIKGRYEPGLTCYYA